MEENRQIQNAANEQRAKFERAIEEGRRKKAEAKISENKIWRDQRKNKEGSGLDPWL